jgi:hypothetical protein
MGYPEIPMSKGIPIIIILEQCTDYYLIVPSSFLDTINHFLCHLVYCAVVTATRLFSCHQHVHNILYTYTTNKPTRHHYFNPVNITFTSCFWLKEQWNVIGLLVNFQWISLLHQSVPDIAAFTVACLWQTMCSVLYFWSLYFFHIVFLLQNVTLLCHDNIEGFCFRATALTTRLIIKCSRLIPVP